MKYLIWDFDGTLGYRQYGMWSRTLLEVLQQEKPEFHATVEQFQPFLQSGFPWHNFSQSHTEIKSPEQWWNTLDKLFEKAFAGIGIHSGDARFLAKQVRYFYPALKSWKLFDDVIPTLTQLSIVGWKHLILSNHVPELRQIVNFLGLDQHISQIFNSAETGYEKPHRQAFLTVLAEVGEAETMWMIGDSIKSDVLGANTVGISSILVRKFHADAKYYCPTLEQVLDIVAM